MRGELTLSNLDLLGLLQDTLAKGVSFRFQVRGLSMAPFIRNSDIVTVSRLSEKINFGRPIAFIHPKSKRLVIHRVVGGDKGAYLVKGDNTLGYDGLILREDILGYVSRVERNNRDISLEPKLKQAGAAILSRIRFFAFSRWFWGKAQRILRGLLK